MNRLRRVVRSPLARGLVIGAVASAAALEGSYINWRVAVAPVDTQPLLIRHDAKGDGRFGSPRSGNRHHRGVDLAAPLGSPVRAIRSGVVLQVGTHRGLGRFIELQHGGRLKSLYAHLGEIHVKAGQRVRQGQDIGAIGKTGNARHPWITPHLHLEVVRRATPVDPQTLGLQIIDSQQPGMDSDVRGGG